MKLTTLRKMNTVIKKAGFVLQVVFEFLIIIF
jgi:hypothetical protein